MENIPSNALKETILTVVYPRLQILAEDKYGNYVIQSMAESGDSAWKAKIHALVQNQFLELANQKFSSNVVQVCLKNHSSRLIDKITEDDLLSMVRNM